jgi:S1-C subfamily serine protease
LGHVVTNAHVVKGCKRITVGDNVNSQSPAARLDSDSRNDLALLKLNSLDTVSAKNMALVKNLGLNVGPRVVPLAANGLLRSEDVLLGENILVAGFPFGAFVSNSIKVTRGIVSSTRGLGDNSGQFQIDAAAQAGNSGGPIYDENGNIVGVVVAQLNKKKFEKIIGSTPENTNFGIKASTVRQFLNSSGLPTKWSTRSKKMSTPELAEIAQRQTLMVICHR